MKYLVQFLLCLVVGSGSLFAANDASAKRTTSPSPAASASAPFGGQNLAPAWATSPAQLVEEEPPKKSAPVLTRAIAMLLGLLAGGLAGAFFSQRMRDARRLIVYAVLALFGSLAAVCALAFHDWTAAIAGCITGAVGAWLLLRDGTEGADTTLGSARWATHDELEANGIAVSGERGADAEGGESHAGFSKGLFLGTTRTQEGETRLYYKGVRHAMTFGANRSSKGAAAIVANLLSYRGSAVVIDPKGENARMTALRRAGGNARVPGLKQRVAILDPWNIARVPGVRTARFNPLDWLIVDPENAVDNAMLLAEAVVTEQSSKDPFWDNQARGLAANFAQHVAFDPSEEGQRHLGRVRDIITSGEDELIRVLARMQQSDISSVRRAAQQFTAHEAKMRSSILSTLQAHTHWLDSPVIRESLSTSDFRFEDLKTEAMTVYIVLPAGKLDAFGRWLRILIQHALTVNADEIAVDQTKEPVLYLLDELAALGKLPALERAFGLMAGFGIQLWGFFQDASQAKRIYGDGWQTFIANSGVLQYLGSRDHMTADYMSKLCGVTTMKKLSVTSAITRPFSLLFGRGSPQAKESSMTEDIVQRQLAFPDELMRLNHPRQLLFIEGCNPILARKLPWFEDPLRRDLGVNLVAAAQARANASLQGHRVPQTAMAGHVSGTASARTRPWHWLLQPWRTA